MTALQRTVRRSLAVLLVPVSLFVYSVTRYLHSPYGQSADLVVLVVSQWVSLVLLAGAVCYLAGTLVWSFADTDTPPRDAGERTDA